MSFQWKERYKLNIDEIDRQHRKLFEIGARVYDLAALNDSYDHYDEVIALLNELLEYTEYHFKYEENIMKTYNYDEFEQQKHDHAFYISKFKSISSEDVDSNQQKTILEIVDFLSVWISNHILLSDRKYAIYFKEKGIVI